MEKYDVVSLLGKKYPMREPEKDEKTKQKEQAERERHMIPIFDTLKSGKKLKNQDIHNRNLDNNVRWYLSKTQNDPVK